jgi:8-oxo-dGTP pyrophosphatase MutT (NUDIX family)
MIKQYRHGIQEISIEPPGGVVEKGEEPLTAIKREVMEETGYEFQSFEFLGKVCANPSTSDNYLHMFLATGGEKKGEQKLDDAEDLEVVIYTIDELKQLLKENKIVQSLHVSCIFYALNKLGENASLASI